MTTPEGSLRVVAGPGRLVRRPQAVLFTPDPDAADLIGAFDSAPDHLAASIAVQTLVVESGFATVPFAVVTWDTDVNILVFGAVEVVTSLRSAPMISGVGSGTWVEHRVADVDLTDPVVIAVAEGADESSDLRLGVTRAGGFALTLRAAGSGEPIEQQMVTETVVADVPELRTPEPEVPELEDDPTVQAPEPATRLIPEAEPADPFASADRLVEAALCTAGHPNPAFTRMCRVCGLAVTSVEPAFISQPTLGRLVFADGAVIELDHSMVIGRKPSATDPDEQVVTVAGDDVSRNHVRIVVRDWDVLITDLSSRNGTYLRVADDPTPARLDPGVEQLLEPATTIHLGSADIAFRFEQNW